MIKKIAHLSDIHIRNFQRHDEYKMVFSELYKSLKQNNVDMIVITGDLIHSKTQISPELVAIAYNFLNNLAKIAKTIIIPGNHDANLSNKTRLNAITPILEISNIKNVDYLKDSCIKEYDNIVFHHHSCLDEGLGFDYELDKTKTNIALYHGVIDGVVNEFNYSFSSKTGAQLFNKYDILMAGDIHKRQIINRNKSQQYAGSLIQQTFSEDLEKGYLLWDIDKKIPAFIKIKNEYSKYTVTAIKNKLPKLNIDAKYPRIRLFIEPEFFDHQVELVHELKRKYKNSVVTVFYKDGISNESVNSDTEKVNYYDVNVQNEIIKKYVKRHNPSITEKVVDKIIELNTEADLILSEDPFYQANLLNNKWEIHTLEISNFFSYGENNKINFDNYSGIIGILGPNAIGKSSIFNCIEYALFGSTSKKLQMGGVLNNKKEKGFVKIVFSSSGKKYSIKRTITKNKAGNFSGSVEFFELLNDKKINMREDTAAQTNKKIGALVGTKEEFVSTSMFAQGQETPFINEGDAGRKKIFQNYMGLEVFELKSDLMKRQSRDLKSELSILSKRDYINELTVLKEEKQALKKEYEKIDEQLKIVTEKSKKIHKKIDDLKDKKITNINIDDNLLNISIEELQEKINKLNEKISEINNKKDSLNTNLKNTQSTYKKIKNVLDKFEIEKTKAALVEYNNYYKEIEEFERIIKNIQNEILQKEKTTRILKNDLRYENESICKTCPLLKQAFDSKKDIKKLKQEKIKYEDELTLLKIDFNKLENPQNTIDKYEKALNLLNTKENEISKIENNILQLTNGLNLYSTEIEKYNSQILILKQNEKIILNNKKIDKALDVLKLELSTIESKIDNLKNTESKLNLDISLKKNKIAEVTEDFNEFNSIKDKYTAYKYYLDAIHRNNIPTMILKNTIPKINYEINRILGGFVDFSVNIEFNDDKLCAFIQYGDDKKIQLEGISGMEKTISGIAIRTALINISNKSTSSFLAIDEGFGSLHENYISSLDTLFDMLKTRFKSIFIISHIDILKDFVDDSINITKANNFSKIN